ncbi:hypothetical protein [Thioclava atlantica]|uniref:PepSY domain-containing protein n=1 Tax=Thioclava atlantica TaxID=1317124 RepID=A0A085TV69_9RHOB|nr:hypothetical protein [Thioclava atlantica]KFE34616.1 hypothetical protein DW2_12215 [Thioclava atlantica]
MNRRRFLIVTSALMALGAGAAQAETAAEAVVRQLKSFGYGDIDVNRTLLGRVRITAARGAVSREIVIDPRTGEVLRDLSRSGHTPILNGPGGGTGRGSGGSGGSGLSNASGGDDGSDDGAHDSSDDSSDSGSDDSSDHDSDSGSDSSDDGSDGEHD